MKKTKKTKQIKHAKLIALVGVFSVVAFGVPLLSSASTKQYQEGQVLVKFKDGTSSAVISKALSESGGKKKGIINGIQTTTVDVPKGREQAIVTKLSNNPAVEYAEVDTLYQAVTNDPYYANQYGLENTGQTIGGKVGLVDADIDAPEAWVKSTGNGVKVAVLDTGIDLDHEDISAKVVASQNYSTSTTLDDKYGHGTHVAGIIAASKDNTLGVTGVCPDCQIMNVKVLGDNGSGALSAIANGITWAADNGAKVINMSLGSTTSATTLSSAVSYAWKKGVVIVAAAGNNGVKSQFYPAAYTNVIAVAATDNRDVKASFSNYGSTWVDVAAPGVNIFSTIPNHPYALGTVYNYAYLSGTSMASPAVAGTAALVWTTSYGTTNTNVRYRIERQTDRIAGTGTYWAYGRVNADRAVTP